MARHPRRFIMLVPAVLVGFALGFVAGGAWSDEGSRTVSATTSPCPGSQRRELEQARAAACLLDVYLALVNEPLAVRDVQLAAIMVPAQLEQARASYRGLGNAPVNAPGKPEKYAMVTAEYATVAAVRRGTTTDPGAYAPPDVGWTAWLCVVDAYAAGSPPLANWYLGHFAVRLQAGRWWLSDEFHADEIATPMTYTQGPEVRAFGLGWMAV